MIALRRAGLDRFATTAALIVAAVFGTASASHHGAHVVVAPGQAAPRVGPSYLYPDPAITSGVPNPDVTQATIQQTICVSHWTATIRPAPSYTEHWKAQQLQAARSTDKSPAHYEEDHLKVAVCNGTLTLTEAQHIIATDW